MPPLSAESDQSDASAAVPVADVPGDSEGSFGTSAGLARAGEDAAAFLLLLPEGASFEASDLHAESIRVSTPGGCADGGGPAASAAAAGTGCSACLAPRAALRAASSARRCSIRSFCDVVVSPERAVPDGPSFEAVAWSRWLSMPPLPAASAMSPSERASSGQEPSLAAPSPCTCAPCGPPSAWRAALRSSSRCCSSLRFASRASFFEDALLVATLEPSPSVPPRRTTSPTDPLPSRRTRPGRSFVGSLATRRSRCDRDATS